MYSADGASACTLCPAGTYCPEEGTIVPIPCPAGSLLFLVFLSLFLLICFASFIFLFGSCVKGYWCPVPGMTSIDKFALLFVLFCVFLLPYDFLICCLVVLCCFQRYLSPWHILYEWVLSLAHVVPCRPTVHCGHFTACQLYRWFALIFILPCGFSDAQVFWIFIHS